MVELGGVVAGRPLMDCASHGATQVPARDVVGGPHPCDAGRARRVRPIALMLAKPPRGRAEPKPGAVRTQPPRSSPFPVRSSSRRRTGCAVA